MWNCYPHGVKTIRRSRAGPRRGANVDIPDVGRDNPTGDCVRPTSGAGDERIRRLVTFMHSPTTVMTVATCIGQAAHHLWVAFLILYHTWCYITY